MRSLPIAGGGIDDVDDDCRQVGRHEDGGGIPAEDNLNLETSLVWQKSLWQQLAALQLVLSLPGQPHIHLLLNCFKLNVNKVGKIWQENHLACLSIKRVVCDVKHTVKGSCVVAHLEENSAFGEHIPSVKEHNRWRPNGVRLLRTCAVVFFWHQI